MILEPDEKFKAEPSEVIGRHERMLKGIEFPLHDLRINKKEFVGLLGKTMCLTGKEKINIIKNLNKFTQKQLDSLVLLLINEQQNIKNINEKLHRKRRYN